MSTARKARGMRTQAAVAEYLRAHGFPYATDAGAGRPGIDILNTAGLSIEVKARANFDPMAWVRQAATRPGLPLVILRPNGLGESRIHLWPLITLFGEGVSTLRAAGFGDPDDDHAAQ